MGQVILFKYEVPSSLHLLAPTGPLSILHCLSPRALPWLENVCRLNCPLLSKGSWPLGIPSRILEDREVNQDKETILLIRDDGGLYQVTMKMDMVKIEPTEVC